MRHASRRFALVTAFVGAISLVSFNMARAGDEGWVALGTVHTDEGSFEAYYDASSIPTPQSPDTVFNIKGIVPNQDFYRHSVEPRDIQADVSDSEGGPIAAYFTEGVEVDCSARVVHVHHMIFHNAKDWWIADHDYGGGAIQPGQGTLGASLLQKVCGS